MLFKAELVRFKSMKDALRIELDIPTTDAIKVMQSITNFLDKTLDVDMNIDASEANQRLVMITDDQKKKINATYPDLAKKYGLELEDTKKRVKATFLGKEGASITDLSKQQASAFIDRLEDVLKG